LSLPKTKSILNKLIAIRKVKSFGEIGGENVEATWLIDRKTMMVVDKVSTDLSKR
jgi:hypothetical protein